MSAEHNLHISLKPSLPEDVEIQMAPDALSLFDDRSKISVYPPFGYAPTKTAPSIRPRVLVREVPPRPFDYLFTWFFGELAFWVFFACLGFAVYARVRHGNNVALVLAGGLIVLYVAAVKFVRWYTHSGRLLGKVTSRTEPPPPLGGIRPSVFDRLQYALLKAPIQNFRFFRFVLLTLPWTVFKLVARSMRKGGYTSPITDEDCWNLFTNTAVLVPAVLSEDGNFLELEAPDDLPLTTPQGVSLASVKLRFEVPTKRVVSCIFHGKDVKDDKELVAGIIHTLLATWCHTKSHLASEAAAREIRNAGAKAEIVAPCSAFTLSLHEFLIYTDKGPIRTDNQSGVKGVTLYQAASIPMAHNLDPRKLQFRYYELLFKARLSVRKLVHKYQVPVSGELLFNTCVVHSLDHLNCYEWAHGRNWSIDLSKSFTSRVMSAWFTEFYTKQLVHWFYSEYIKDEEAPFFKELYQELHELDAKLADSLLLSTSY